MALSLNVTMNLSFLIAILWIVNKDKTCIVLNIGFNHTNTLFLPLHIFLPVTVELWYMSVPGSILSFTCHSSMLTRSNKTTKKKEKRE